MADEKTPEHEREGQETDGQITRRQFLVGAGVGAVVGAAGVAGISTLAKPGAGTPGAPVQVVSPAAPAAQDLPATMRRVTLNTDGVRRDVVIDVRMSLWEVMVYELGMASSNLGCDRAQCGACTVAIDGRAVNGCTVLAARLGKGQKILTVDGISKGTRVEDLHPIARAYWQEGGFQCGICTRGFIMSTYALLQRNPSPTEADVREALGGNICRCGEYPKVYDSVMRAAEDMRKKS